VRERFCNALSPVHQFLGGKAMRDEVTVRGWMQAKFVRNPAEMATGSNGPNIFNTSFFVCDQR
jgi:hypothetical protein